MFTSLRLVDFKNFRDETLHMGPLTVIVGANASGKSNLRDAFRFLHGIGRGYTLGEIIGGKYGAGGQQEWAPIRGAADEIIRFGRPAFELRVKSPGIDYSIRISRSEEHGAVYRVTKEELNHEHRRVGKAHKEHAQKVIDLLANMRFLEAMTDVFVLCVDRDGNEGRRQRLDQLEQDFGDGRVFIAENAWEELETWVLAGVDLPTNWSWTDVRAEVQVKERYFDVLVEQRGLSDHPGGGRKPLAAEAAGRLAAIRQECPEDFDALARRIEAAVRAA